ncbi:SDR family oxidoreductase, partial [Arenicella sp.]|nr:SDR family oxidoreductase [Arenicella sp.]
SEGANVAINYFGSEQGAKDTLSEIEAASGKAFILQGDMTKQEDVAALVEKTQTTFDSKEIHGLVNVAGGLLARKTIDEMDLAHFNKVIELNLNSTFLTTKAISPLMSKGASIVNLASQAGRDGGGPGSSAYACSKGAVITFTRSMAKELGPKGIRVNSLCPGMISTLFHDTFTNDQVRTNVAGATPLRREGSADEVADAVSYLCSDESSFIHGANIDINGGLLFS